MTYDRILGPWAAIIRAVVGSRLDYLALYPATVVAQNADGTLELQPDDARLPGLSAVPIRCGLPGVAIAVTAGARVLLGFEGGSPRAPVATLWDTSRATISFNGGTLPVARCSDPTVGHTHAMTFSLAANLTTGVVTGTITAATATDSVADNGIKVLA